jgi:hypothetical protein
MWALILSSGFFLTLLLEDQGTKFVIHMKKRILFVNVSGVQIREGSEILKSFAICEDIDNLIEVLYIIMFLNGLEN